MLFSLQLLIKTWKHARTKESLRTFIFLQLRRNALYALIMTITVV